MTTSTLLASSTTKAFPTPYVLSVFLDVFLTEETTIDGLQECLSWCAGKHIFTHSMMRKALWDEAAEALLSAYPSLSDYTIDPPASRGACAVLVERAVSEFGEAMSITWGCK